MCALSEVIIVRTISSDKLMHGLLQLGPSQGNKRILCLRELTTGILHFTMRMCVSRMYVNRMYVSWMYVNRMYVSRMYVSRIYVSRMNVSRMYVTRMNLSIMIAITDLLLNMICRLQVMILMPTANSRSQN